MNVSEVMRRRGVVPSGSTVRAALREMDEHRLSELSIVADDGRLRGVVRDVDLIRELLTDATASPPLDAERPSPMVDDVMSRPALDVHPGSDLADAVDLMASAGATALPVTDGEGRVLGTLTRGDVVHLLAGEENQVESEVLRLLAAAGFGDWLVAVQGCVVELLSPEGATASMSRTAAALAHSVPGVLAVRSD